MADDGPLYWGCRPRPRAGRRPAPAGGMIPPDPPLSGYRVIGHKKSLFIFDGITIYNNRPYFGVSSLAAWRADANWHIGNRFWARILLYMAQTGMNGIICRMNKARPQCTRLSVRA